MGVDRRDGHGGEGVEVEGMYNAKGTQNGGSGGAASESTPGGSKGGLDVGGEGLEGVASASLAAAAALVNHLAEGWMERGEKGGELLG